MANATKATKTITASPGSCASYILEPGVQFQRKTNLPANWKRIRVGLMLSVTNLVDANGTPTSEPRLNLNSWEKVYHIGMSNGVGMPGTTGNKFVGLRAVYGSESGGAYGNCISLDSGVWGMKHYASGSGYNLQYSKVVAVTGGSFLTSNTVSPTFQFGDPTATSACMSCLILEFDATSSGVLTVNWRSLNISSLSDPSDSVLVNLMNGTTLSSLATFSSGGWWPASDINCQFLDIRFPFLLNRMRIHNMMILDFSSY